MGRSWAWALLLAALVLGAGCGYRVVGVGEAGQDRSWSGASGLALWLGPVEDDGDELLFGALFASQLAREAVDRPDLELVSRERSRAWLTARVDAVWERGVAYAVGDLVREYALVGTVTATLNSPQGDVLWHQGGIRADRDFAAGDSVDETQDNKNRAKTLLARDLAREVLRRVAVVLDRRER